MPQRNNSRMQESPVMKRQETGPCARIERKNTKNTYTGRRHIHRQESSVSKQNQGRDKNERRTPCAAEKHEGFEALQEEEKEEGH